MVSFVDHVTLHLRAGDGGNGCTSIRREKFKPLAGPDGGNGGDGGSITLISDHNVTTLLDYHHRPHRTAKSGGNGQGDFRNGEKGEDMVLPVPVGTVVRDSDGNVIADLEHSGMELLVARGGAGGLGNAALANRKRIAPGFHLLGVPGWQGDVVLELKTVADIALVGFPSAGKSSLVAALSSARPKIADYPFTTLHPNLGVVAAGDQRYTIADVPGLIEGASEGKGLGLDFLRHVERCSALCHVIDCATMEPGRDPMTDFNIIRQELEKYEVPEGQLPLLERPQVIALNKIDVPEARELAEFVRADFEKLGLQVFLTSTATTEGLTQLSYALAGLAKVNRPKPDSSRRFSLLEEIDDSRFVVTEEDIEGEIVYRVTGSKPERWVAQTDFGNSEAIGFLAERLNKLGVEDALTKAGAKAGSTVIIGKTNGVVFDWDPFISSVVETIESPRGTDIRLDGSDRRTTRERRAEYYEMMDQRAKGRAEREAIREKNLRSEEE
jgi:GTP-binding protein